nr:DDE-type integrase/transposase/recombinase [Suicoccus acidiformans]
MCRQIRKMNLKPPSKKKKRRIKKKDKPNYSYPGELVQIDVKYVPIHSIGFASNHKRYYQITAIDAYSRTKVLDLMNENSTYTTSEFLIDLEKRMGFKIDKIQTDNGKEFTNDSYETDKKSRLQRVLEFLGISYKTTAPYSPWQNGLVERSHREDEERFYSRRRFSSEEELRKALARYNTSYNNTYRKVLNFKSPDEVVNDYFAKEALDGVYVIVSDVNKEDMTVEKVVDSYRNLSKVESAFRTLKGPTLQVRPIYHRKDDRIEAHVFICFLA